MVRPVPKHDPDDDADAARSSLLSALNPLRIIFVVVQYLFPPATSLRIASRFVPLLVGLSLVPLILFLSLFSGWYIWKNIPVSWQVPVYLQYGDGRSPYAELSLPPLSTTQPYDVSLQLVLPASEANFALGNFMTTLSLLSPSNRTLLTVSRPSIALPPKRSAFFAPRLVDVDIPLLSSYLPGTSSMNARIDIGRRDGWKSLGTGQGRELSVWNAALKGVVRLQGIRGLVSRFPLTSALVGSATFFTLSVIVLAACILPAVQWRTPMDETQTVSEPKEERPVRIRKRPRRTVVGEGRVSSTVYKSEDTPVDIPSGLASDDLPLRRRRSRISDVLLDSEN